MKVIFDSVDLNEKLKSLLRLEGLLVKGDIQWSVENPSAAMNIEVGVPPQQEVETAEPEPLKAYLAPELDAVKKQLDELRSMLNEVNAKLAAQPVDAVAQETKKDGRTAKGKKDEEVLSHDKMAALRAELEKEAELVGNPLGSKLHKGRRSRAANEFDEFPKG